MDVACATLKLIIKRSIPTSMLDGITSDSKMRNFSDFKTKGPNLLLVTDLFLMNLQACVRSPNKKILIIQSENANKRKRNTIK